MLESSEEAFRKYMSVLILWESKHTSKRNIMMKPAALQFQSIFKGDAKESEDTAVASTAVKCPAVRGRPRAAEKYLQEKDKNVIEKDSIEKVALVSTDTGESNVTNATSDSVPKILKRPFASCFSTEDLEQAASETRIHRSMKAVVGEGNHVSAGNSAMRPCMRMRIKRPCHMVERLLPPTRNLGSDDLEIEDGPVVARAGPAPRRAHPIPTVLSPRIPSRTVPSPTVLSPTIISLPPTPDVVKPAAGGWEMSVDCN